MENLEFQGLWLCSLLTIPFVPESVRSLFLPFSLLSATYPPIFDCHGRHRHDHGRWLQHSRWQPNPSTKVLAAHASGSKSKTSHIIIPFITQRFGARARINGEWNDRLDGLLCIYIHQSPKRNASESSRRLRAECYRATSEHVGHGVVVERVGERML